MTPEEKLYGVRVAFAYAIHDMHPEWSKHVISTQRKKLVNGEKITVNTVWKPYLTDLLAGVCSCFRLNYQDVQDLFIVYSDAEHIDMRQIPNNY